MALPTQRDGQWVRHIRFHYQDFSESCPAQINLTNTAAQTDCVLFDRVPGEIRTRIFEYALSPSPDPAKPYPTDRVFFRPYLQNHPKTNVALLQTCKLIWSEARLIPVAQATHYFWFFGGPWRTMRTGIHGQSAIDSWRSSLSMEQRRAVKHVHIFLQQYVLESLGANLPATPGEPSNNLWDHITTRNLYITFRRSDWWSWQSSTISQDRLGICPWLRGRVSQQQMLAQPLVLTPEELRQRMIPETWGRQIGFVEGLQRLEIEFETEITKKDQLEKVLERARHWVFPLEGRKAALINTGRIIEDTWIGPEFLKNDNDDHLSRRNSMTSFQRRAYEAQTTYYTAVMTWKAVSETSEEYLAAFTT